MTGVSFVQRKINITFYLGTGQDGTGSPTVVKLPPLRCRATTTVAGGVSMGELNMRVYGMPLSLMNQLSTLGAPYSLIRKNSVMVEAGDDQNGMATVYQGTIAQAWADFEGSPDTSFNVVANAGLFEAMAPAPPGSYQGGTDAATIMKALADKMGLTFENNGVSGIMLSNAYHPGTLRSQAEAVANAANINWIIENNVLAIWPKTSNRGGTVPIISKDTGMVLYPNYSAYGMVVRTLFAPDAKFGGRVKIASTAIATSQREAGNNPGANILPVDGEWVILSLSHDLSAELPGGPWFTELQLTLPGYVVTAH